MQTSSSYISISRILGKLSFGFGIILFCKKTAGIRNSPTATSYRCMDPSAFTTGLISSWSSPSNRHENEKQLQIDKLKPFYRTHDL